MKANAGEEWNWCYWDGEALLPALPPPVSGDCPEGKDWIRWMAEQGWQFRSWLPGHRQRETSPIEICVFSHDDGRFLAEVMLFDMGVGGIVCSKWTDFLFLLRDLLLPLVAGADRDTLSDVALEAAECLLDGRDGLKAAQRVKQAQWRQERLAVQQRKQS